MITESPSTTLLEETEEIGTDLLRVNKDRAWIIQALNDIEQAKSDPEIGITPPAAAFSLQYLLYAGGGHGLIKTPETSSNPNFVITLQPNEQPADYGLEYHRAITVGEKRYVIDSREQFEDADPESIFWTILFTTILEPGEEYVVRGSCIKKLFQDDATLKHLPYFLKPLADNHNWNLEIDDPENSALQYLRQFADFKPNIDIYVDQQVIDRLLQLQILGGSIEKITLDNGVVGYRVNYDGGYVNSQGVNLVLKPPSNNRRIPISHLSTHAAGNIKVEFGKVQVYVAKEYVLALGDQESIDFEALQTLPPAEQLLQIARFIRFNALYKNEGDSKRPLSLSSEIVSQITDMVSSMRPEDIESMTVDLAAAIGSELMVALMSNPELVIHIINHTHPDLFPYLNRENLQNEIIQQQLITAFTRYPLQWRNPRSGPTLDTSRITHMLINDDAVRKALNGMKLDRRYEIDTDIPLTWQMSRPGDIVRLSLSMSPIELINEAKTKREIIYDPDSEHRQYYIALTKGPHGLYNYEEYLQKHLR
jgi:hypothetical protein